MQCIPLASIVGATADDGSSYLYVSALDSTAPISLSLKSPEQRADVMAALQEKLGPGWQIQKRRSSLLRKLLVFVTLGFVLTLLLSYLAIEAALQPEQFMREMGQQQIMTVKKVLLGYLVYAIATVLGPLGTLLLCLLITAGVGAWTYSWWREPATEIHLSRTGPPHPAPASPDAVLCWFCKSRPAHPSVRVTASMSKKTAAGVYLPKEFQVPRCQPCAKGRKLFYLAAVGVGLITAAVLHLAVPAFYNERTMACVFGVFLWVVLSCVILMRDNLIARSYPPLVQARAEGFRPGMPPQ
jgi:hypothetical protein